jgi:iron uptake system component EfeO
VGAALLLTGCRAGDAPRPPVASASQINTAAPSVRAPLDPRVTASVRSYEAYLRAQAAALPARVRPFTDAVRAGNLAAAKKNYAASRAGWERIQSVAILLPRFDRQLDAEADDFASTRDPAWTGWHRLEHILWTQNSTAGAAPYADRLDHDLGNLNRAVATLTITPKIMADSIERLAEEAIAQKLPGAEDRYSRTDLADLAGNLQGIEAGYAAARPVLVVRNAELTRQLERQLTAVDRTLGKYRTPAGYRPYEALSAADHLTLQAELSTLAETLAQMSGALER